MGESALMAFTTGAIEWGTVAQWAGVVATSTAIIVALFGDRIKLKLWSPRLVIKVGNTPELNVATFGTADQKKRQSSGVHEWYVRAEISNEGESEAKDCEVICEEVWRWEGRRWIHVTEMLPIPLKWSFFHREGEMANRFQPISRGLSRHIDLFHVTDPLARINNPQANKANYTIKAPGDLHIEWELDYVWYRNNRECWHIQPAGKYRMMLRLAATGVVATENWIEFDIPDDWTQYKEGSTAWLTIAQSSRPPIMIAL